MKRKILFFTVLFIVLIEPLYSQSIHLDVPDQAAIEAKIEYVLAPLDMSPVSTGILQDRTFPMGVPQDYEAHVEQDSLWSSMSRLDMHYQGLYAARLSGSGLTTPEDLYYDDWQQHDSHSSIPLTLLGMDYHRFLPTAVDAGILTITGGQLHHGSGYGAAQAYEQKYLLSSGFYSSVWEQDVDITISTDMIIGNRPINIASVSIDMGEGQGYQSLSSGSLSYHFSTTGDKIIKVKFTDHQGYTTVNYHRIKVMTTSNSAQDRGHTYRGLPLGIECSGFASYCNEVVIGQDTILASTRLACGSDSSSLNRPFIILDGIDLTWDENLTAFEDIWTDDSPGLRFAPRAIFTNVELRDVLTQAGYDVIFVDYYDHHVRIQDNAALVMELLRRVNAQLQANGSDEPIRMMGISMGGVVGKYALLKMEEAGERHNVDKYFTFDSPMQGANVPLAIQGVLETVNRVIIPGYGHIGKEGAVDVRFTQNVIESPAALQMTRYNIFDPSIDASWDFINGHKNQIRTLDNLNTEHIRFYRELEELGELQQCKYFAISNGSDKGLAGRILKLDGDPMLPGDLLFNLELENLGNFSEELLDTVNGAGEILIEVAELLFNLGFGPAFNDNTEILLDGRACGGAEHSRIFKGRIELSMLFGLIDFGSKIDIFNGENTLPLDGLQEVSLGDHLLTLIRPVWTYLKRWAAHFQFRTYVLYQR